MRTAYYTNESFAERDDSGRAAYHAALVTEGEAGYARIEPMPDEKYDLAALQARCDRVNEQLGHTPDDVLAIVASSMAQGKVLYCTGCGSVMRVVDGQVIPCVCGSHCAANNRKPKGVD